MFCLLECWLHRLRRPTPNQASPALLHSKRKAVRSYSLLAPREPCQTQQSLYRVRKTGRIPQQQVLAMTLHRQYLGMTSFFLGVLGRPPGLGSGAGGWCRVHIYQLQVNLRGEIRLVSALNAAVVTANGIRFALSYILWDVVPESRVDFSSSFWLPDRILISILILPLVSKSVAAVFWTSVVSSVLQEYLRM